MRDMENCAGDWFLLDQEMDKALKFSGYGYSFRIINGGHVAGYYDYWQEAMSYLWKGWPQPVQARPSAPRVRDIILPDENWQLVAENRHDARGPACNASGDAFFVEVTSVWYVKDGQKTLVDTGLKFAAGLAYRPDQWLLSVADGRSKWAYSYKINADGTLANKERYFWLHVPDGEDDAGADSICYAQEGPMLVATRWGIQICADDGPTQVILPTPDRSRVLGVCLGGREKDMLFAFCGDKIWKRKVKVHGIGAFSPWAPATGSKL